MGKRYAILYDDGSFGVDCAESDLIEAQRRLGYNRDAGEAAKLVEVEIRVVNVIHPKNPAYQVVTNHSAECPVCGTEVFIEKEEGA